MCRSLFAFCAFLELRRILLAAAVAAAVLLLLFRLLVLLLVLILLLILLVLCVLSCHTNHLFSQDNPSMSKKNLPIPVFSRNPSCQELFRLI